MASVSSAAMAASWLGGSSLAVGIGASVLERVGMAGNSLVGVLW